MFGLVRYESVTGSTSKAKWMLCKFCGFTRKHWKGKVLKSLIYLVCLKSSLSWHRSPSGEIFNVPVKHKWQRARSPSEISGSLKTGETVAEVCMNRLSFLVMFTPNQREQFFNFVVLCGNKQKRRRCRDVKPDGSRSGRRLCIVNCVVFVLVITCFSSRRDALILSNKSAVGFFTELTFFDEVSCLVNPPHQTLGSGSLVIVPIARYLKFMLVFTELFP